LKNTHGEVVALGLEGVQSVKHGETYTFSERDNLVTQKGRYKNDQKHGTWINYHPGGFVPAVISTYKNGKLDGEFSQYSRSGNKLNEIHYRKGLKDGLFVVYGENGKPVSTKMFKKGIQLKQVMGGEGFTPE
jgi:antitoxin component YwqK of YwqJK toxin-antitoxin module